MWNTWWEMQQYCPPSRPPMRIHTNQLLVLSRFLNRTIGDAMRIRGICALAATHTHAATERIYASAHFYSLTLSPLSFRIECDYDSLCSLARVPLLAVQAPSVYVCAFVCLNGKHWPRQQRALTSLAAPTATLNPNWIETVVRATVCV